MFKESVEAQEQRFLTEGTSIDSQGNVQSLSEEQQHWLKENLDDIKQANGGTVPVRSLMLDFSDYRSIDYDHFYQGGEIHTRDRSTMNRADIAKPAEHYYLKETLDWINNARKINKYDWSDMPKHLAEDRTLVSNARCMFEEHTPLVNYLKEQRAKNRKK
jgi:hypothetical protein